MIDTTSSDSILNTCRDYIGSRQSDYEFRCIRFDAVIDRMSRMGLADGDSVLDVGCGRGDFRQRLAERGFDVRYTGVDGAIDGRNLNTWSPSFWGYDWIVAIEVLEHLYFPKLHLINYKMAAVKGVVITTPNPATVDVLACDPTHVSIVYPSELAWAGYDFEPACLFNNDPQDSLIGWCRRF
ncbi:MAG: class I SAM-dependent methyltransferase [Pyrinomonadaceae bacterium]